MDQTKKNIQTKKCKVCRATIFDIYATYPILIWKCIKCNTLYEITTSTDQ